MHDIARFVTVSQLAARAGGAVLLDWIGRVSVREKGPADLVTEADEASQRVILELILGEFPRHGFLAEENAAIPSRQEGLRWLVDPLDGTTNFVHQAPHFAVSVALEQHGEVLAGTVFDPVSGECFSAGRGLGARLGETPLHVSQVTRLARALVAVSFPPQVGADDPEIHDFLRMVRRAQAIRRLGSTALNLCFLAAGRFDASWSRRTHGWDIAAGALILTEAGGVFTDLTGGAVDWDRPQFAAAATAELHRELRGLLAATSEV
jgi:myo-inositol-1(or 4)-monophosphatase